MDGHSGFEAFYEVAVSESVLNRSHGLLLVDHGCTADAIPFVDEAGKVGKHQTQPHQPLCNRAGNEQDCQFSSD